MSRIALVDDDRHILTSLAMVLEAEGFKVETHADGQAAHEAFSRRLPDLAVLDIKMPRMDGMDLLQRLRRRSQVPVIVLTSKEDEIDELLGFRLGADDYLRKPFSQTLLLERIRALLRRTAARSDLVGRDRVEAEPPALVRGRLVMDVARHMVTWDSRAVPLTVTEFLILQALAQRPGVVKSREQLLDVAYKDDLHVDERTIDSHVKRLRRKLKAADPGFDAIETLYGMGYRFNVED
jgi:two-component system, OmpR family, response regulator ChvI